MRFRSVLDRIGLLLFYIKVDAKKSKQTDNVIVKTKNNNNKKKNSTHHSTLKSLDGHDESHQTPIFIYGVTGR